LEIVGSTFNFQEKKMRRINIPDVRRCCKGS
jgi:hypothetical protein